MQPHLEHPPEHAAGLFTAGGVKRRCSHLEHPPEHAAGLVVSLECKGEAEPRNRSTHTASELLFYRGRERKGGAEPKTEGRSASAILFIEGVSGAKEGRSQPGVRRRSSGRWIST